MSLEKRKVREGITDDVVPGWDLRPEGRWPIGTKGQLVWSPGDLWAMVCAGTGSVSPETARALEELGWCWSCPLVRGPLAIWGYFLWTEIKNPGPQSQ